MLARRVGQDRKRWTTGMPRQNEPSPGSRLWGPPMLLRVATSRPHDYGSDLGSSVTERSGSSSNLGQAIRTSVRRLFE